MVSIPGGWFSMGCEAGRDDEKPVHRIWVDSFEMAACQVTRAEYAVFLAATGRPAPPFWEEPNFGHPAQPVVGPSWHDAVAYCDVVEPRLGPAAIACPPRRNGNGPRAEAARVRFTPGATCLSRRFRTTQCAGRTVPEPWALYAPNAYGLFNMGDNVHEWCADWYDARYYEHAATRNPQGPSQGGRRASRGGSWRHRSQVFALLGASEHSPRVQVRRLRFSRRSLSDVSIYASPLAADNQLD